MFATKNLNTFPNNNLKGSFNSRLYKFIVGEVADGTATEFHVYDEAIAQLSTQLRDLVQGRLSETIAGYSVWKDVRKKTFERFVQFAYTGDYSIPSTTKLHKDVKVNGHMKEGTTMFGNGEDIYNDASSDVPPPFINGLNEISFSAPSKKDKKKKDKKKTKVSMDEEVALVPEPTPEPEQWEPEVPIEESSLELPPPPRAPDFYSLDHKPLAPRNNYDDTCEPASVFDADRSYSSVLLAHAALYSLGDLWSIDSLKALALYKLYRTLCVFKLDEEHTQDIVDLARYVNTKAVNGVDEEKGGITRVVGQYMSHYKFELAASEDFMDLLGEGGKLVKDFFRIDLQMH